MIHYYLQEGMKRNNLIELLTERSNSLDSGITFIERSDREEFLSYSELYRSAISVLSFLQGKGVRPGNQLVLQIEDNKVFIIVFWACILGGIIPVPLTIGKNDDHKQKLFNIWPLLTNPYLIIATNNFYKIGEFAKPRGLEEIYSAINGKILDEAEIFSSGDQAD